MQDNLNLFVEQLEDRVLLSSVQIHAAGATGQEQLDLFIDDQHVTSFFDVGGDIGNRDFEILTYQTTFNPLDDLTADRISIAFGNDLYDPNTGFDRNLAVDKIVVNGVTYQTEHPSTESTGIWDDGFTGPGQFNTELMNINAIFDYSSEGAEQERTGIIIEVKAQTGEEAVDLIVGGELVNQFQFNFANQRNRFVANVDTSVNLEDVRVQFSNDLFDPANQFDRNLRVYSIQTTNFVTGEIQIARTTDANVYSQGVWLDGETQPGFGRGANLFSNGFIEVRTTQSPDSTNLILDTSFGDGGLVQTNEFPENTAVGPQGQIATSSTEFIDGTATTPRTSVQILTVRNPDGSLSTSFGDGDGNINLTQKLFDTINNQIDFNPLFGVLLVTDLDFFDDGSLLVMGHFDADRANSANGLTPIIAKLNPDGSLSNDYASRGFFPESLLQFGSQSGNLDRTLATVAADGSAIVAGVNVEEINDADSIEDANFVVTKLNSDGEVETNFGFNGNVFLDHNFLDLGSEVIGVETTSTGAIYLVTGGTSVGTTVIKLTPDGSIDSSFANSGFFRTSSLGNNSFAPDEFRIDSRGRIILADAQSNELFNGENLLVRVTADGELDSSFGNNGFATYELDPPVTLLGQEFNQFALRDFIIDDNDRILTFATAKYFESTKPPVFESLGTVIVRLDESGNIDRSFNNAGYTLVGEIEEVRFAGFDANGDVLLNGNLFALAKLKSD